ncbi:MAG TPA: GNAT family N-acetyltransferase [Terriglobales bacterium]|nr:GNAT family N-acetyltransferase [Terriglobales bacterium]
MVNQWSDCQAQAAIVEQTMTTMTLLETRSLLLRPFAPSEIQSMLAMSQEDCARKWLPSQVYQDKAHAASAVDWLIRQFDLQMSPRTNAFVFGVADKATGLLIGHVGLSPFSDGVEVGFGIATSEQGKGYATEAVSRACAWGFERFSLRAILGITDAENVASQRVLQRCGFRRKEEKMMPLQGVERRAIIFELTEENHQQTGCAEGRDRATVDNR